MTNRPVLTGQPPPSGTPEAGGVPWPPRPGLLDPRNDARSWAASRAGAAPGGGAGPAVPLVVARARNVHLRSLVPDDLRYLDVWADDATLEHLVGSDFLRAYRETYDRQPAFYGAVLADPTQIVLLIVPDQGDGTPVGLVRLFDIHVQDGYASMETIVADRWAARRGFGVIASRLIIAYGVDVLGLRRIECKVYAYNQLSINGLLRNGFVQEGVLRQAAFKNGRYWDIMVFGILRDEIEAQRRKDRYLLPAAPGAGDGSVGDSP